MWRFQSTPPRGWRHPPIQFHLSRQGFQSTPPRGWRLVSINTPLQQINFNPLHHEGGDAARYQTSVGCVISIHSTTRVETQRYLTTCGICGFQSTPPRGWRPYQTFLPIVWLPISIHSTTRVETAILHNNHYYSSTHFHKQIISHPLKSRPTIPAHSQIRSHCANFPVRISP